METVRVLIMASALAFSSQVAQAAPACVSSGEGSGIVLLDCQGDDVVPVYEFLASVGGHNIVVHPSVRGTINLRLTGIRWDQALEMITSLMGHRMRYYDNTVYISLMGEGL